MASSQATLEGFEGQGVPLSGLPPLLRGLRPCRTGGLSALEEPQRFVEALALGTPSLLLRPFFKPVAPPIPLPTDKMGERPPHASTPGPPPHSQKLPPTPHYTLAPEQAPMLFAHVQWVSGSTRSLLYDLQQQRGLSLPPAYSDMMELLELHRGTRLNELLARLDEVAQGRLVGLVQFLIDRDMLFCTQTPERFPRLSLRYRHPSVIQSALLDVDEQSDHDLPTLTAALESLGCERLVVRLKRSQPLRWLETLLAGLKEGRGMSLELFLELASPDEVPTLLALCAREPRIATIHAMNALQEGVVHRAPSGYGSVLLHSTALDLTACEAPTPADHVISQSLFAESQGFNTFTHRKVCISARGELRNTVGEAPVFGDLHHDSLQEIVKTPAFQAAWTLHKGMIRECRDCERRHMCVDPRLPQRTEAGDFAHERPCAYLQQQRQA